ncbi:hypothetical protein [Bradyrhizobium sp. CCGUVB23]|uniref:hypothetical protein n=1 Tax=Bradyrhizobium sp. CCGUVB23 TaxID=2949630 RepID=UPI0020B2BA92|nr:hypothetical protein [Bradyrhizobium sp. CCGUVB23]MCP3467994.1 hypothetical protein [Bradyrhizobium sp. CCGUVB23]
MYRGLLGDFFLVRHAIGSRVFKMLIDCGVLQCIGPETAKPSTAQGKERIVANVADFIKETGGHVDLVVATHQHYDHLSGFILAREKFETFTIDKVWMAWSEDRTDKVANGYRNKMKKALAALAGLALNPRLAARSDSMQTVNDLLQFYGGLESIREDALGLAKPADDGKLGGNASCEAVLAWLRKRAGAGNVSFLKPGDVVRWGLDDVFRAYVLGPPRDDVLLRKLAPSKSNSEVYLARSEDVATVMGLAAIHGETGSESDGKEQPFTRLHQRRYNRGDKTDKAEPAKTESELAREQIIKLYETKAQNFDRWIDDEWLGSAESLALKIDGDVNNTSLALALELTDKRVLLFPGDAQVGNWLSWGRQNYPADDKPGGAVLRIEDILARAIFYKVGHHASHNATLRERGLELMTNSSLVAMIPVVEETAREQKTKKSPKGWAMPYDNLYGRLNERTGGRIIRGDGDTTTEQDKLKGAVFELSYGADFKDKDPLWAELRLEIG